MNCCCFLTVYFFIVLILRIESKVAHNKAGDNLLKTSRPNALPNAESKPFKDAFNETNSKNQSTISSTTSTPDATNIRQIKYPFIVSIQTMEKGRYKHLCGGTILNKQFVITAAHCTLQKTGQLYAKNIMVVGGSNQLFHKNATRFRVRTMKKHPNFIPLRGNDILLLHVEPEIPIDNIQFGTIDFKNTTRKSGIINALLLGWGRTQPNKPKNLEVVPFHTIGDDVCFRDFRFKYLTNSEICAVNSAGPRGACDGDSGGPLIDLEQQDLYGILSYGRKPCEVGKPFAFTRISIYVKWIEEQMAIMLSLTKKRI